MINLKSSAAFLAALAILMGDGSRTLRAEEWPGNDQPRLEITQNLLDLAEPGKPFFLDLCVRNLGTGVARSIHVFEKLPDRAELLEASPNPSRQEDLLTWSLATLKPGGEYHIRLRLRADSISAMGKWPSKVRVEYQSEVGNVYAIELKRPKIELSLAAPKYALLGEQLPVEITVSNTGTWTGHNLNLRALMSGGLIHESGADLENEIGDLPAGQSCTISLPLKTQRTGKGYAQLRLTAKETESLQQTLAIDIRDVRVDLGIHGPTTASADWACTYDFVLSNQGSDALPATKLVAQMPKNLTFVRASGNGACEANSGTVSWDLPECGPGESLTCVLSGVARDGPGEGGCVKVLLNKHAIKEVPWGLRLLERPSSTSSLSNNQHSP